ncbi:MAG TPA: hypothetical protein VFE38_05735 [Edaphobacter sp.]|nr:hypothetical protein [Edaphobacter sp.]
MTTLVIAIVLPVSATAEIVQTVIILNPVALVIIAQTCAQPTLVIKPKIVMSVLASIRVAVDLVVIDLGTNHNNPKRSLHYQ